MADAALRTPPEQDEQGESLPTSFDLHYTWRYEAARLELKNLYEKAKRDQWNATDQLPWSTDVDPEREIVPDIQIPVYGTHIWEKLTDADIRKLRREALSWTLSQFMHGEQGALLATAQIVDATPWIESKFYGATQVMDEARHVEVYSRYLREKLTGSYPVNRHLKTLLDQILTDSRWDMKYLGMQIMVEGLAMAAFGYMHKMCQEPLLTELTHYVMRDESRHVAFGVLSLSEFYHDLPARELREREEFLYEGCRLMRDRLLMEDVWEVMGWPVDEVREIVLQSPQMKLFRQMLFSKVVPNVKRLGLLSPYVRERFAELDILQFENEEPSARASRGAPPRGRSRSPSSRSSSGASRWGESSTRSPGPAGGGTSCCSCPTPSSTSWSTRSSSSRRSAGSPSASPTATSFRCGPRPTSCRS